MPEQLPSTRDDEDAAQFVASLDSIHSLVNRVAWSRDLRIDWTEILAEHLQDMGNPDYVRSHNDRQNRYLMQSTARRNLHVASLYAYRERLDRQALDNGIDSALGIYVMAKTAGAI